jgi:hypothetical protein
MLVSDGTFDSDRLSDDRLNDGSCGNALSLLDSARTGPTRMTA